jgi:anti-sigma B factor antagonist
MSELTFETIASGADYVIHCKGRLVSDHAFLLRNHLKPLIPNARRITLDMTEVTYVDSMGLGTVASLYVSARTAGCQFEVINLSRRVREMFSVARLLPLLEVAGRSSLIP